MSHSLLFLSKNIQKLQKDGWQNNLIFNIVANQCNSKEH